MPDFFSTNRELTIGEIVALTRASRAATFRSTGASATLRRSIRRDASDITFHRQRKISRCVGRHPCGSLLGGAAFRG